MLRDLNRRRFLEQAATATCLAWVAPSKVYAGTNAGDAESAAQLIAGKDARLIVHSATPAEIETPLELLRGSRLTPKQLLFVRNNQFLADSATLEPLDARGWKVEIGGLVDRPAAIDVAELAKLEQVDRELVLQCSGNGRAMFSRAAPAKGAPWQAGAMGNVQFSGVPLAALFKYLAIAPQAEARFLTAEGRDIPTKPNEADFEHSIPLDDALARSILALRLNGEPIPAVHGGPVRLVTPGYYATTNVKWLSRLRLEAAETNNYHQVGRYRTPKVALKPGDSFTTDLANSDANWRMRTKSVIFAPLDGQRVPAGRCDVRGVAFNDGAAEIETVLVSTGGNSAWLPARIEPVKSPYAWHHWSVEVEVPRGASQIMARAIDTLGRTQPLSAASGWNPAGYAFNSVHVVNVTAD